MRLAIAMLTLVWAAQAAVPPHLMMERLSRMTPSERARLLSRLPAERRSLLEERLAKYSRLPDEDRRRLRDEYEFFQHLPVEKQAQVRKLYRSFSQLPVDRRRAVRRELVSLRAMSPDERAQRIESETFRANYDEPERQILTALIDILRKPVDAASTRP